MTDTARRCVVCGKPLDRADQVADWTGWRHAVCPQIPAGTDSAGQERKHHE